MPTMNIFLPDSLKASIDEPLAGRGDRTSSKCRRGLIHKDQDRQRLPGLLLAGAESVTAGVVDAAHFEGWRVRVLHERRDGSRLLRTTVQASDGTGSAGSSG